MSIAGARIVHQLQILYSDLLRRFGNVRDLLVAVRVGQPVENRHGDVIGS
jgi:hypothetical protein